MEHKVLIISESGDIHAKAMIAVLEKEHGIQAYLLDMHEFPLISKAYFTCNGDLGLRYSGPNGQLDLGSVKSIWWRRSGSCVVPNDYYGDINFCQDESNHFLQGFLWSHQCFWINDPVCNLLASRKIVQLSRAKEAGLLIPKTIITNSPHEARKFIKKIPGQVVFKRTGTSPRSFSKTNFFTTEIDKRLDSIVAAPTTFQEYIEGELDLRVIWIDGELFAVSIDSKTSDTPEDSRFDLSVSYQKYLLPSWLSDALRRLMLNLRLVYGAIDLRLGSDGKYYFLEVNPAGQFVYLELKTGIPLMSALASALARGYSLALTGSQPCSP